MTTIRMYQHIQLFGREGHYTVRLNGSADEEHRFTHYDDALLFCIEQLAKARSEVGAGVTDDDTHVKVLPAGGPAITGLGARRDLIVDDVWQQEFKRRILEDPPPPVSSS